MHASSSVQAIFFHARCCFFGFLSTRSAILTDLPAFKWTIDENVLHIIISYVCLCLHMCLAFGSYGTCKFFTYSGLRWLNIDCCMGCFFVLVGYVLMLSKPKKLLIETTHRNRMFCFNTWCCKMLPIPYLVNRLTKRTRQLSKPMTLLCIVLIAQSQN